jgi:uncharacterized protein
MSEKFRELLDQNYEWPDYYIFKFIVPVTCKDKVMELLKDHEVETKESKKGNYISITSRRLIHHTDEVILLYEKVSLIKGVMSL